MITFFLFYNTFFHFKFFIFNINLTHRIFFDHSEPIKKKLFFLDLKSGKITRRTEASQSAEEKKPTRIPSVTASEQGSAQARNRASFEPGLFSKEHDKGKTRRVAFDSDSRRHRTRPGLETELLWNGRPARVTVPRQVSATAKDILPTRRAMKKNEPRRRAMQESGCLGMQSKDEASGDEPGVEGGELHPRQNTRRKTDSEQVP